MRHDSSVLDTLRATAVLLVLFDHLCETLAPIHPYDWYLGRLGVLLFFVHTSCVLMMSMRRTTLVGWPLAWHFYVRRVFRIYPLSILTVLVVLVAGIPRVAWSLETPDSSVRTVVANLLLVQDLAGVQSVTAPLWSLPLEIQMYVLLPAIFVLTGRGNSLSRAWGIWTVGLLLAITSPLPGLRLQMFVPCFLSGILGFCLSLRVIPRVPFWIWPLSLLGLTGLYVGISIVGVAVHSGPAAWLTCLLAGLLLPLVRETTSWVRPASATVAKYSYGIYLAHMPALWVAFAVLAAWPRPVQWGVFILLLAGVSALVFHLIEQPLMRLGGRIADAGWSPGARQRSAVAFRQL